MGGVRWERVEETREYREGVWVWESEQCEEGSEREPGRAGMYVWGQLSFVSEADHNRRISVQQGGPEQVVESRLGRRSPTQGGGSSGDE